MYSKISDNKGNRENCTSENPQIENDSQIGYIRESFEAISRKERNKHSRTKTIKLIFQSHNTRFVNKINR